MKFFLIILLPLTVFASPKPGGEWLNFWDMSLAAKTGSDVFPKEEIDKKLARRWYSWYLKKGRNTLADQLVRAQTVRPVVEGILRKKGVPEDFFYLALIESGFDFRIESHMGARGPWQFVSGTAKKYGLKIREDIDERMSLYKSTVAAADYLLDLYNVFNSWVLAAAAYNAGEYRILRAIQAGNTRSYKKLSEMKLLPPETVDYVAKIWVVRAMDGRVFGKPVVNLSNVGLNFYRSYKISHNNNLSDLAGFFGVSRETLLQFNSDLTSEQVQGSVSDPVTIFVPRYIKGNKARYLEVKEPANLLALGMKDLRKGDQVKVLRKGDRYLFSVLRTGKSISVIGEDILKTAIP